MGPIDALSEKAEASRNNIAEAPGEDLAPSENSRASTQGKHEADFAIDPTMHPESNAGAHSGTEVQNEHLYSSNNSSTSLSSSSSGDSEASNDPSVVSGRASIPASQDQRTLNIDNPLGIYSRHEREQKVVEFIGLDEGLQEFDELLKRGAIHAAERETRVIYQDDQDGKNLSMAQKDYLKNESTRGSLEQSKNLLGSLLSTCLAGMIQGWTQSAINGSNLGMVEHFGIDLDTTGGLWMFGLTAAVPFIVGGVIAPLISDPLQEHYLGRRGAIALACVISVGATVGQATSRTKAQLIGCRVLTGITLAAKASAAPLLTAEVAPNHLRGSLLATWQLSDAFGIFLGFAANLAVLDLHASSNITWRVQTITVLIPTVALLFVVYLLPESPRFLMKRGKFVKALESFILLRPKPAAAIIGARDFIYAHFQLETESKLMNSEPRDRIVPSELNTRLHEYQESGRAEAGRDGLPLYHVTKTNYLQRLAYFWRVPRARRALTCAVTAMVAQQLTGINTIMFLSATLIKERNGSDRSGAWVGFVLGLCNFIFGLPAFYFGDIIGRATLLLLGFPPMFLWMLLLAISFKTGEQDGSTRPVLFGVFGILFAMFYSPTAGTSPFAISAEVFPLVIREVGHSLAVAVNFVLLGVILLVFPIMSNAMGGYSGGLGLFAALNVLAFILCFLFVPETKGRTLEELQFTFDLPTRVHIRYRVQYITKWLAYRFVLPPALKLGLYKEEKLKQDRKDFKHRLYFFRWGREEVQRVEARGDRAGNVVEQKQLFYPFGVAKIRKPITGTTPHAPAAVTAAEATIVTGPRSSADQEKL